MKLGSEEPAQWIQVVTTVSEAVVAASAAAASVNMDELVTDSHKDLKGIEGRVLRH